MTPKQEADIVKKVYKQLKKDDAKLESYKSLAALYIQVDESVMTRHKFFLTTVIAVFSAIGYLFYQLDDLNFVRSHYLIRIAFVSGIIICIAWLMISKRGLYIDKVLSEELEHVENEFFG